MKKSEASVRLMGPLGPVSLQLELNPERIIQSTHFYDDGDADTRAMLEWLVQWLLGHDLPFAYENVAEAYLQAFPNAPWTWSQLPQELVRQALYQTHSIVQTEQADEIVCRCHKIRASALRKVIQERPGISLQELGVFTKAGTACGSCRTDLERMLVVATPSRRWEGKSYAEWVVEIQSALDRWQERSRMTWVKTKQLEVASFRDGVVKLRVGGGMTADQEWELSEALSLYLEEGFAVPFSLFLDFSLA